MDMVTIMVTDMVIIMSDITDIIIDQKTEQILTIQLIENVAMMVKRMLTEESFITEVKRLTKRVSSSLHTLIATIPTAPATRNLTLIQATTIIIIMVTDITMVTTDMTTDMVMDTIITDMITITMITITMITTTMGTTTMGTTITVTTITVTTITGTTTMVTTITDTIMTMIITDTDTTMDTTLMVTTMTTILTLPPLLMVTTTDTDMVTIIMKESLLTPTDMIIIMDIRNTRDINTVTTMVTIIFLVTSTRLTLSMAQVGTVSSTVRLPVPSPVTLDSSQILESTVTTATQLPSLHGHLINNQQFVSQLMTTVMVIIITVMEDMTTAMVIMDMIILTRNIKNTIRNRRKLTKRPKRIKRRRIRPTNEVSSTKLSKCPITKSLERLIN